MRLFEFVDPKADVNRQQLAALASLLKRQNQTEINEGRNPTPWERPKAREGFNLETPQPKVEPSIAMRTMDSNSKLNSLLKKS